MRIQVYQRGTQRGQLRAGDGLCTGEDVRHADKAGAEDPAGREDQPEQPHAGHRACTKKEGRPADTGRQGETEAANVSFRASLRDGEVV